MRIQNNIFIKAVAIREEDGLEIGTEYDVEDIMIGQSNTSVSLVGMKGSILILSTVSMGLRGITVSEALTEKRQMRMAYGFRSHQNIIEQGR